MKTDTVKTATTTIFLIIAAVLAVFIFSRGYQSAAKKYEDKIQKLEEEVARLSDSAAVYEEVTKEIDIRAIEAEIREIGELATIEYLYTDAGKFEDPAKLFGKNLPFSFTTKSFIAKWDGSIKAGVDVSKIQPEIKKETKEIIIHIPKAEILSHEIYDESIETLNEKNGLFNKLNVDDVRTFDIVSKDSMEQKVIDNGILDKAFDNAKEIICRLINTDIVNELEYTVTVDKMEEM